jgi:hypothetical protein
LAAATCLPAIPVVGIAHLEQLTAAPIGAGCQAFGVKVFVFEEVVVEIVDDNYSSQLLGPRGG